MCQLDPRWPTDADLAHAVLADDSAALEHVHMLTRTGAVAAIMRRYLRSSPRLRQKHSEEDLLQIFFHKRILTKKKRKRVFGPVAKGKRFLQSRLAVTARNFVLDLLRKLKPCREIPFSTLEGDGDASFDPAAETERESDTSEARSAFWKESMAALASCAALTRGRAPLLEAFLLAMRVLLLKSILRHNPETAAAEVADMVARAVPWDKQMGKRAIGETTASLDEVWQSLCAEAAQGNNLTGDLVAFSLAIPRSRWDKWIERGRLALVECFGPDGARLRFPFVWRG